jgi:hypothetical protein
MGDLSALAMQRVLALLLAPFPGVPAFACFLWGTLGERYPCAIRLCRAVSRLPRNGGRGNSKIAGVLRITRRLLIYLQL